MISILLGPSVARLQGRLSRVLAVLRHILKSGVAWHRDCPMLKSVFASSVLCLGQTGRSPLAGRGARAGFALLKAICWALPAPGAAPRRMVLPLLIRARPVFFIRGLVCLEERSRRPWGEPHSGPPRCVSVVCVTVCTSEPERGRYFT